MIYISTGGFHNQPAWKTSELLLDNEVKNVELSGGTPDNNMLLKLKKLKERINFQVHNYFPPPKDPFVFNLGSLDKTISTKSIEHASNAIKYAKDIKGSVYSFHAGFLIDPKVDELGRKIINREINDRKDGIDKFLENVAIISKQAEELGISLLIENNVLSYENYKEFKTDPLLMTTPEECEYIMYNTPNNVNMLVDVAHLKVSSNTLEYNPVDMFKICESWIKAYHFSDNDGLSDSNNSFDEKAWFWPYIKCDLDYYSIEVYNLNFKGLKELIALVKTKLNQLEQ